MDIFYGISDREGFQDFKFKDRVIVIGGGGLITTKNNFLQNTLEYLVENNKVILWGIGSNTFEPIAWDILNHHNIVLAGIRDISLDIPGVEYLPCVSCKHNLFDYSVVDSSEIGIIEHIKIPVVINDIPRITNGLDITQIVDFISSKESIISTTFHGVYWSQLLNKKVAIFSDTGKINSKLINIKHRVSICNSNNYLEVLKYSSRCIGLLEESRYLNDRFYEKFKSIIV